MNAAVTAKVTRLEKADTPEVDIEVELVGTAGSELFGRNAATSFHRRLSLRTVNSKVKIVRT